MAAPAHFQIWSSFKASHNSHSCEVLRLCGARRVEEQEKEEEVSSFV